MNRTHARTALLGLAAALVAASIVLPLWRMTLVSVQYPEGLRMVVYPTKIVGDITEINMLNHYIGMAEVDANLFPELRVIPVLFGAIAIACLFAVLVRRAWFTALPLVLMVGAAVYGFSSMLRRLYEYGHDLDPTAAIDVDPFTPAMVGEHVIAQFATYAYFTWGTILPALAGAMVAAAFWLDLERASRAPLGTRTSERETVS